MGGDERMVAMMYSSFTYARIEHTSDVPEYFNETGLVIVWMNPYYMRGKPQINKWVYPLTNEGFKLASKDAMFINNKIKKEVEETSFMRKKVYN